MIGHMQTYQAKDFANRDTLEAAVSNDLGQTTDTKDAVISGTAAELRRLFLNHGQRIWGVPVRQEEYVEPPVATTRPQRGALFKSSINKGKNEDNKSSDR